MVKFLLIRHGQSQANADCCFAGHLDTPATELGYHQAECAARFVAENYTVDAIYSSDLQRAAVVGQAVSRATGIPMHTDRNLREIMAGDWEGLSFEQLSAYPSFAVWRKDVGAAVCDGGESVADLQKRIVNALTEIAQRHPNQTVVIATHATPIRAVQCYCMGKPISYMQELMWVTNASVTEIFYDEGSFRLGNVSIDYYLGNDVSALPADV